MLRILFLVLWVIPVFNPPAWGAIEIYAHGHKYDSWGAYAASKELAAVPSVKVNQSPLVGADLHQFYVRSVEHGFAGALMDFYQTYGHVDILKPRSISSDQLQDAIKRAVTSSQDPRLLITGPGKVRIMSLHPDK